MAQWVSRERGGRDVDARRRTRERRRGIGVMKIIVAFGAIAAVVWAKTRVVMATSSPSEYFEARLQPTPSGGARVRAFGMVAVPKCFPTCAEEDSVERPNVREDAWRVRDEILVERFEAAAAAAREAAAAAFGEG